jgi:hypothetical protein
MYRCLTEFPSRTPGCVVPLSTLTFELDGGRLWPQVADWEAVVVAIVNLTRHKACDAMPLGLPRIASALLANGPTSTVIEYRQGGGRSVLGERERQAYIDELTDSVHSFVTSGPFYPGDNLAQPPDEPLAILYKPYRS